MSNVIYGLINQNTKKNRLKEIIGKWKVSYNGNKSPNKGKKDVIFHILKKIKYESSVLNSIVSSGDL